MSEIKVEQKTVVKSEAKLCLLHAAAKLFSKLGLEKTSTRDLARESKANISLISYHFGGKEGLYKEVMKDFALEVQNTMHPVLDQAEKTEVTKESFSNEISMIVQNMISMRKKHPEICQILCREKANGMPLSRDIHEDIFYPLAKRFIGSFENAQQKKVVRPDIHAGLFFICMSEGLFGFYQMMDCQTSLQKDCEQFMDAELLKNQILNIYLNGVLL
jgi:AcrR family transcriptional regulator